MNAKTIASSIPAENPERAGKSAWNLKELMDRLEGDHELLRELLQMFRTDAEMNMRLAADALLRSDLESAGRAAHTLKGMLKNLAMNGPGEIAAALENAARDKNIQEATAQMPLLEKALKELQPEIETQLTEVQV
jgi:two-component system sensor histidine kinase/response regulator